MRQPIKKLFENAYGNFGLGAFNVFNAEQILAVFKGASRCKMPFIIQITPAARNFLHPEILEYCIRATGNIYKDVDFSVHLDHGDFEHCTDAIKSGNYNSVMIDASHEQFNENVRITREIVKMAHAQGIAVEAELGVLSGVEDNLTVDSRNARFTDPQQAKEFVKLTQCDSLAVAVGTSHGAYKFSGGQGLQLGILARINNLLPGFPLVLHGASAVPYKEIERINNAGGELKADAKGTERNELLLAIKMGVCKINIATDMRLIWTRVHREFFLENPDKFDMTIPGSAYISELENFVASKCRDLILSTL